MYVCMYVEYVEYRRAVLARQLSVWVCEIFCNNNKMK